MSLAKEPMLQSILILSELTIYSVLSKCAGMNYNEIMTCFITLRNLQHTATNNS